MIRLLRAGRTALLAALWLLAACGSPPTTGPLPTPQVVRVAYPPSLRPASSALHACALAQPQVALLVSEKAASELDVKQADLSLWFGEPPSAGLFAAPLAQEEILVIVHPQNPLSRLESGQLRSIFSGEISGWQTLGGDDLPIQVWVYPRGNELRSVFEAALLPGSRITTLARLAPEPDAMVEAVSQDKAAIGYLPRAYLSEQVKSIQLDETLSANLEKPVLALASSEPAGAARAFVVCLQSGAGQKELEAVYKPLP